MKLFLGIKDINIINIQNVAGVGSPSKKDIF